MGAGRNTTKAGGIGGGAIGCVEKKAEGGGAGVGKEEMGRGGCEVTGLL